MDKGKDYYDLEKLNLASDKMYPLSTASAIIWLLSSYISIKEPYKHTKDTNLEDQYLEFFFKSLSDTEDKFEYVSYDDIIHAITSTAQTQLKFLDIQKAISVDKIFAASYLLLLYGYPDNYEDKDKYYPFDIGEKSTGANTWPKLKKFLKEFCADLLNNDLTSSIIQSSMPLQLAMYCILYCIMPYNRPYEFTFDSIADIAEQIYLNGSDNIIIDYNRKASDGFRVRVKEDKKKLLNNLGKSIKNYKTKKKYLIPINVAAELIAYFSYKDEDIYKYVIKNQAFKISDEQKADIINHFNNVVGYMFKYIFCYNHKIRIFPYKPCTQNKCDLHCKDPENCCYFYFKYLKDHWSAKLDLDIKFNHCKNSIAKISNEGLKNIKKAIFNNQEYFTLPDFDTHYLFHYDLKEPEDIEGKQLTLNFTYYERLFFLKQLQDSLSHVYSNWLEEVENFEQYKKKDCSVKIDYANWYKYQFNPNDLYIQRFKEDPESYLKCKLKYDKESKKVIITLDAGQDEAELLAKSQNVNDE